MSVTSLADLASKLRGTVVEAGEGEYDQCRKVYNAMIDRRPRAIARCADTADVVSTIRFARDNGLRIAIRGGGHNAAGLGVCDDGLVVDLSPMRGVRVDPDAREARVAGGCVWGDVDHATHAFGMAVPSGVISTTGVGGLTLGGGLGHLSRKYGLTIDNLLEADVVLSDGRLVKAGPQDNADLFWALRGGGGNFGVVTSFLFRTHPVHTVVAGPTLWPVDKAGEVLRRYREFLPNAPEDVNGFFAFLVVPPAPMFPAELHGKSMCGVVWCYTGPHERAERELKPLRSFGRPAFDHVGPMPFPALQSVFDALYPPGLHMYWKADFLNELPDAAVEAHARHGSNLPTMLSTMHLYPVDGAVHRFASHETAFSYRDATWAEVIVGVDSEASNRDRITRWARDYFDATHPYSAGGAYVNFMMDEGEERVEATYRGNYRRLQAIKHRYDPENVFSVNQNIKPRGVATA